MNAQHQKRSLPCRIFSVALTLIFSLGIILPPHIAQAQVIPMLPLPGTMVAETPGYVPALIKGVTIHPDNPLAFDFIIDTGHSGIDIQSQAFKDESVKLIKYFMASLTVPAKDMWVNLSPYEKDRIIPESFGKTAMGMDLLAQDYILKQLTASMIYPEKELGKKFWNRVRERAAKEFGAPDIPLDNLHKVWIIPDSAFVYEKNNTAFVVRSHLKVMLEQEYFALQSNQSPSQQITKSPKNNQLTQLQTEIMKEIIIPEIEKEVNEGKNFAQLRQIYRGMILATWFKQNLKESLLGQVYVDQKKLKGIDINDPKIKDKIYQQYLAAFKQGVYNYIREDYDPATQQVIPQQYFSGGFGPATVLERGALTTANDQTAAPGQRDDAMVAVKGKIGTIALVGANLAETKAEADQIAAAAQVQTDEAMLNSIIELTTSSSAELLRSMILAQTSLSMPFYEIIQHPTFIGIALGVGAVVTVMLGLNDSVVVRTNSRAKIEVINNPSENDEKKINAIKDLIAQPVSFLDPRPKPVIQALESMLGHSDPAIQQLAIVGLARFGLSHTEQSLEKISTLALTASEEPLKATAASFLIDFYPDSQQTKLSIPALLALLRSWNNKKMRIIGATGLSVLGQRAKETAAALLEKAHQETYPDIQTIVASAVLAVAPYSEEAREARLILKNSFGPEQLRAVYKKEIRNIIREAGQQNSSIGRLGPGRGPGQDEAMMSLPSGLRDDIQNTLTTLMNGSASQEGQLSALESIKGSGYRIISAQQGIPLDINQKRLAIYPSGEVRFDFSERELNLLADDGNSIVFTLKAYVKKNASDDPQFYDIIAAIPRGSAVDVAQEAMLEAVRKFNQYDGTENALNIRRLEEERREVLLEMAQWRAKVLASLGGEIPAEVPKIINNGLPIEPHPQTAQSIVISTPTDLSIYIEDNSQGVPINTVLPFMNYAEALSEFPNLNNSEAVKLAAAAAGYTITDATQIIDKTETSVPPDEAMAATQSAAIPSRAQGAPLLNAGMKKPGGIDLNPELLNLKIKRDGNGIPLPMPQQPIEQLMQIDGFLPVIISITPIQSLPMLLGMDVEPDNGDSGNRLSQLDALDKIAKLD